MKRKSPLHILMVTLAAMAGQPPLTCDQIAERIRVSHRENACAESVRRSLKAQCKAGFMDHDGANYARRYFINKPKVQHLLAGQELTEADQPV